MKNLHQIKGINLSFKKSSFSGDCGVPYCVACAKIGNKIIVINTKANKGQNLSFSFEEWDAFLKGVKAGEFDL